MKLFKFFTGFYLLFFTSNFSFAQEDTLFIPVVASFHAQPLVINDTVYHLAKGHHIKFENLKFYLSKVCLLKGNAIIWEEENSFHLFDFEDNDSNALILNIPEETEFTAIQFFLGIDSLTNVSGAMGGDLDPTKGMYWTWQSGYINFKLEGTSDLCINPKNEFQYHLGGYITPFNNLQQVKLAITNNKPFRINFNLDQYIQNVDLENINHIMSPNQNAVEYAKIVAKCFSIK